MKKFKPRNFQLSVVHFMKKFKPMKVTNSSIRLPDGFLDALLLNDGDYLVIVEEDGKFFIRKTYGSGVEEPDQTNSASDSPPPSIDEMMKKAQEQLSGLPLGGEDLMKTVENTLKDPKMMKKIQEMAEGMFKAINQNNPQTHKGNKATESKKKNEEEDDEDDDDDESGFKINIE